MVTAGRWGGLSSDSSSVTSESLEVLEGKWSVRLEEGRREGGGVAEVGLDPWHLVRGEPPGGGTLQ